MMVPYPDASLRIGLLVPAGGYGSRMGGLRKQFIDLYGAPMLAHTLHRFISLPHFVKVVVALPRDMVESPPGWLVAMAPRVILVEGGRERGDSVRNALEALTIDVDLILVHDAARPLVPREVIFRAINAAAEGKCVIPVLPVSDTVKVLDETGRVVSTPDRNTLFNAQTPQAFPAKILRDAYARSAEDGYQATDDAALVAHYGTPILTVQGDPRNIKVTTAADLPMAEALIAQDRI